MGEPKGSGVNKGSRRGQEFMSGVVGAVKESSCKKDRPCDDATAAMPLRLGVGVRSKEQDD